MKYGTDEGSSSLPLTTFYNKKLKIMTDKELLIKDLCARLPYGVKLNFTIEDLVNNAFAGFDDNLTSIDKTFGLINDRYSIESVKPYLFPMSSMTEEQIEEFRNTTHSSLLKKVRKGVFCDCLNEYNNLIYSDIDDWLICIDWLNEHHFVFLLYVINKFILIFLKYDSTY